MSMTTAGLRDPLSRTSPRSVAPRSGIITEIVSPELWDRTIAQFDEVCQEQLYAFAKTRWPHVKHEPVLFWRGGEVVGGSLMMIQPLPLKTGALAVAKWGPMRARVNHPEQMDIYREMVAALADEYATKRRLMLARLARRVQRRI